MQTKRTRFYAEHKALGAKMTVFAGWEMPLSYGSIVREHMHTRTRCSVFDTSHMGLFALRGAEADLERLVTQSMADLAPGRCAYGYMLDEMGGTIDDLICFRRGGGEFLLTVNAGTRDSDAAWIKSHISSGTAFEDLSGVFAKLDIQGPQSKEAMEACFKTKLPELRFFEFAELRLGEMNCLLSRSGYTGEFGYELFVPAESAAKTWKKLLAPGAILPAGLGARDTLRFEMGYPLYGHELKRETTPAGVSQGRFVALNKDFVGKSALCAELASDTTPRLVGLVFEGRMSARPEDIVIAGGLSAGAVSSGMFAPSLGKAAALAFVKPEFTVPGSELGVQTKAGKVLNGRVSPLPLYTKGSSRTK